MKKSTLLRQGFAGQGPKIIVIVGPNASGKSELGVRLAKKLNGEIISADSRQVYKKLDVGSGKVRGKWENGVFVYKKIPHHCIDIADPKKVFTALDFKKCAQRAINDIASRNKTPIIIGGTGFYIDAALGRVKLGGVPPNQKLRKRLAKKSAPELLSMLKKLDPKRAKTIEQKNPRRLIRAIEIALSGGGSADSLFSLAPAGSLKVAQRSSLPRQSGVEPARFARQTRSLALPPPLIKKRRGVNFAEGEANASLNGFFAGRKRHYDDFAGFEASEHGFLRSENREASSLSPDAGRDEESKINIMALEQTWVGIKRSPEELKKRIRARLLRRLLGIIREVKKLRKSGISWKRLYDLGLEYRYVSLFLRGKLDYKLMTIKLQTAIWQYARRQMTYFKKNKEIRWISC